MKIATRIDIKTERNSKGGEMLSRRLFWHRVPATRRLDKKSILDAASYGALVAEGVAAGLGV